MDKEIAFVDRDLYIVLNREDLSISGLELRLHLGKAVFEVFEIRAREHVGPVVRQLAF